MVRGQQHSQEFSEISHNPFSFLAHLRQHASHPYVTCISVQEKRQASSVTHVGFNGSCAALIVGMAPPCVVLVTHGHTVSLSDSLSISSCRDRECVSCTSMHSSGGERACKKRSQASSFCMAEGMVLYALRVRLSMSFAS